ncbi:MAG: UvrD-helicase domain-containing protein [Patescibacteria group bacterium]|nr:UvrD-helicase domain-containing protein [Patescibacteria group bacterium]
MSKLLTHLNKEQTQAVTHETGPAIVLAGAGSGKTRVLTTRAAWLVTEKKIQPDKILLVTFTNKAASEMNKRVEALTSCQLPFSGTYHSFCARILRKNGDLVGLNRDYSIFDSSDQMAVIRHIYKDLGINKKKYKQNMVKGLISKAKNELITTEEYLQSADSDFKQTVGRIFKVYQHRLKKQNAVDFDDLLLKVVFLLKNNQPVLQHYQQQFNHVLVDEYQDTNKAQYQLTKLLSQPQNNVYVVGDFSQSIYAWRGADYRNLFYLQQEYQGIKEYRLERNYRSTKPILKAATKLISNNTTHPVLNLWTDKTSDEKITVLACSSSNQEATAVVKQIQNQLSEYSRKDIAILYRTNAQSRAFEEAFIKAGIPYKLIGGFKFYERREIKDVLAYLRVAVNPQDEVSYNRLLKVGKRRYQKFAQWLKKQKEKAQQGKQALDLDSPYELLKGILKSSNYLGKYDSKDPDDQDRIENVQELLNVAAQFQDSIVFLENVSLVQDNELKDTPDAVSRNKISLMSLHSAKGLEFPVVFMVGFEEGLLPHSRSSFEAEKIEEERRLCYVGITRAKKKLYLTYASNRWMYGRNKQSTPSRFLSQIPPELTINKQFVDPYANNGSKKSTKKYKKKSKKTKKKKQKYRIGIEVNEDELDALLKDEIDIREFLK